jgi:VanZ family protein
MVAAAVAALLWWSSARPSVAMAPSLLHSFVHNFGHIAAYALFGGACWFAFWSPRIASSHRAVLAILLAVAYGAVDELHQSRVPGRTCSPVDWLTDLCGAVLAICWLRWRLADGPALARRALPWWALASIGSAMLATFGPW